MTKDRVVFVTGAGNIALDVANNRLFLRFTQGGVPKGASSVAVRRFVQ